MGDASGVSRRYGGRHVELGKKKCFTAEPKCGILIMYLPVSHGNVVSRDFAGNAGIL